MLLKADWVRNGRRATFMRDIQIQNESSAFIIFEGPKSRYYLDLAERLTRRYSERSIYVVAANTITPTLLELEESSRYTISEDHEHALLAKNGKQQTTLDTWAKGKCLITDDV